MTRQVLTIDGPAGAGKTTVARAVAARLGWRYVDTGAMYRALTLAALERGIDPADAAELAALAGSVRIGLEGERVHVDDRDVTEEIRDAHVTRAVSTVSSHEGVRRALVGSQRDLAAVGPAVVEGRDIGSTVLPDAGLKIFLTASPAERARRRAREMGVEDRAEEVARVEEALAERDRADSQRAASPLRKPTDAIVVDSSGKPIDAVVDEIIELAASAGWT